MGPSYISLNIHFFTSGSTPQFLCSFLLFQHDLTLSYSSKINSYLYLQRVSLPLKKKQWYVLRGQRCPSRRVWQPFANSNVQSPLPWQIFKKGRQMSLTICRGLSRPSRSLSRIVCSSVPDPGCLSRIHDPDFYPSRIQDPGSRISDTGSRIQKQQQQRGMKKN